MFQEDYWPLTKFWEFLGHVDLFWDFDSLSKEERKTKRRSRDLDPLLVLFLGFWEYVMGKGCNGRGVNHVDTVLYFLVLV
jgi:hypothetical protein